MQRNVLLESASFPVEIGKDEIEMVSGGTAVIDYDETTAIAVCPNCPPPQPKLWADYDGETAILVCPGCPPPQPK